MLEVEIATDHGGVAIPRATGTRLFLVLVVLSVAFGAASLLEHLVRDYVPTDIQRKHSKARERQNMRMMLKILIPTETGNHAIKDGSLHRIFETTMSCLLRG